MYQAFAKQLFTFGWMHGDLHGYQQQLTRPQHVHHAVEHRCQSVKSSHVLIHRIRVLALDRCPWQTCNGRRARAARSTESRAFTQTARLVHRATPRIEDVRAPDRTATTSKSSDADLEATEPESFKDFIRREHGHLPLREVVDACGCSESPASNPLHSRSQTAHCTRGGTVLLNTEKCIHQGWTLWSFLRLPFCGSSRR